MNRILLPLLAITVLFYACGPKSAVPYPQISGHRGANFIAPENTLASADSCIRLGIDVMETDVVLSKDSVFYILHDSLLNRTTNGTGPIREWLSKDLDTLDAGSWFGPAWKGHKLPRFADLLAKAQPTHLNITVDYRTGDFQDLVDLIDSYGMLERTYFTFSSDEDTKRFREMFPDIHTLQAYVRNPRELDKVLDEMQPDIAVLWIDQIDLRVVKRCHERGVKVLALILGLDDKTAANRKAIRLGVDVIATDKPELLVK
jgi:glycerophosphoryl diester phosphodiesterase